jgi:molecular chaperone Hsp33
MAHSDTLQRFLFENMPVRGELIHLEQSFQTIADQHNYPLAVRVLLGEALAVAGLLSAILKFDGRLTVQFRGKGKLKMLLAQCDNQFRMRGLVQYEDAAPTKEELIASFAEGVLAIMLDADASQQRYQGIVAFKGQSLAESIEGYFRDSEQLKTKICLNVNEHHALGCLLQIIPGQQNTSVLETQPPAWQTISAQLNAPNLTELSSMDSATFLKKYFPNEDIRLFEETPVRFHCGCTRNSGENAILLLGKEEAEAELNKHQVIVVTCDFCNREYIFDRADVAAIFENNQSPPPSTHLH